MSSTIDFKNNDDLAFFGKVNASISHELKNILAIISEAAGLLQDLTEMAKKGQQIEMEMLNTCSQDIVEEIQRGFTTIKQMNMFSHSVDEPLKSVNVNEVIDLMIHLAGFLSFASKVRFDLPQDEALTVSTCPFRLQNLVYQTLVFAFKSVGVDGEIQIAVHREADGSARIAFSGLGTLSELPFPSEETKKIATSIGAEIRMADDSQALDILVSQFNENSG
jgi:C4-dicarboxylate-specific signal transduction histidine kinase